MKILLLGEYSRLHNSLKEGLIALNHEVEILGFGDGFKNYPVDYKIKSLFKDHRILFNLSKLFSKFFIINLIKIEHAVRAYFILKKLDNYDLVQLINESSFQTYPYLEIKLIKFLLKKTNKLFLLSCGEDYYSINYGLTNSDKNTIMTPYLNDKSLFNHYKFTLEKTSNKHYKLHQFINQKCNGIIASDIDYHLPLINNSKYLGMIPNPINPDKINYQSIKSNDKINIFLGVNTQNQIKKGITYFELALNIISSKHPDKIIITKTEDLPYKTYINTYNSAHIILDQVFGFDQGYNALEAMAKGKVVFTGAEKEWLDYYNIEANTIAINALPDVDYLVQKLEWLILNPNQIETISKNARAFVLKNHDYKTIAKQYVQTWKNA